MALATHAEARMDTKAYWMCLSERHRVTVYKKGFKTNYSVKHQPTTAFSHGRAGIASASPPSHRMHRFRLGIEDAPQRRCCVANRRRVVNFFLMLRGRKMQRGLRARPRLQLLCPRLFSDNTDPSTTSKLLMLTAATCHSFYMPPFWSPHSIATWVRNRPKKGLHPYLGALARADGKQGGLAHGLEQVPVDVAGPRDGDVAGLARAKHVARLAGAGAPKGFFKAQHHLTVGAGMA